MSEYEQLRTELTRLHAELSAVDAALGEYYCPARAPETDESCGSFYRDHGVHLMMEEIERLRTRLRELESAAHVNEKSLDEYAQTVHSLRAKLDRVRLAAQEQSEEIQLGPFPAQVEIATESWLEYQAVQRTATEQAVKCCAELTAENARLIAELDLVSRAAQEQSEEVQCNWLSPAEAEGLRRQLAAAEKQAQMAGDALDWLRQKRGSGTSTSTR